MQQSKTSEKNAFVVQVGYDDQSVAIGDSRQI